MSAPALPVPTAIRASDTASAVATGAAGPVPPEERIALLDILRGFALFGILLVNFLPAGLPGDGMTWRVLDYLIEGSFYAQFALLFGIGFAVQLLRAGAAARRFVLRYLWRTAILFGIGVAHYVLLWGGDILHAYALLAVVLLVVHRAPRLLVLGLALLVLASQTWPERLPLERPALHRPNPELALDTQRARLEQAERRTELGQTFEVVASEGSYADVVAVRWAQFQVHLADIATRDGIPYGQALGLFLLGLWVGRGRVLEAPREHRRLLWGTFALTFVLGVLGAAVHSFGDLLIARGVLPEGAEPLSGRLYTPGNVALGLWYATSFTLLVMYSERWARWLSAFGWVGRAGLTNYLLQSAVMTTLLFGYGLGLEGTLTFWPRLGVMLVLFVAQALASRWWLQRFRFGPVEWLWRALTWGAAPAIRAAPPRSAVHGV